MPPTSPIFDWLEHQPDPAVIAYNATLADLRIEHWNAGFARLLGLRRNDESPDEIRSALIKAGLFDPHRAALFAQANQLALRTGHYRTRWQFRDATGKRLSAEVDLTALPSLGSNAYCVHIRDVSTALEKKTEPAAIEARFRDLFEVATDAFGFVSIATDTPTYIDCNTHLTRIYGATDKKQVIGKTPLDFAPPTQPDGVSSQIRAQAVCEQARRAGFVRFDWFSRRLDGDTVWLDVTLTVQPSWGEGVLHFSGRDITDRKHAEQALAQAEELARVTLQSIADGVITTDPQGRVTALNPIAERLTGWSYAEALGQPVDRVFRVVHESTRTPLANPLQRSTGSEQPFDLADPTVLLNRNGAESLIEDSAAPISMPDGTLAGAVIVFRDVTDTRRLAAEISHQARHDPLTGLPNRREFERRLEELLEQTRCGDAVHALCYVDLDQFKVVNDGCGHAAGDQLLAELASALQQRIRRHDLLARLGGDEFGVLLVDCPTENAHAIASKLLAAVADFRFRWGERSFVVGASIGVVPITATAASATELLSEADLACYTAKDLGRNRIHLFRPDDADLTRRRSEMQWARELHEAIEEQRLQLYTQPIHALHGDPLPWFEVLLRLRRRDGHLVMPGAFLPAAERFGLMPLIDRYVLTRVLGRLLDPARGNGTRLSVNLSGRSLEDAEVIGLLEAYFENPAHPAGRLCLELTETTAVSHLGRTREFIGRLRGAGCLFALDDFGTGVSSFAYLKHLPVDFLKLDGSFVRDITREPIDHAMVEAIHRLSTIMGFQTIAEFVEDAATLELLREIGVNYGQGFLLGRPAPIDEPG
ncbi:EAL domain-containing protein [Immundisolibacter sp.]|uniref:bifunctional diguanylate cyclase/phosphodiesterase n=1 Tax=Immundisolibacter sp. TaxID=1934948 RepID=UPI003565D5DA